MTENTENYIKLEEIPELYRTHLREILAYIYNFVHNDDDARELTQDVFYKICEQVKKGGVKKINFRAYLYKTAKNHVIDKSRKKSEKKEYLEDREQPVISKERSPENGVIDSMMVEAVSEYIDTRLSEKEGMVFKLRYYQQLNLEEIAEAVDTSIASVSRIIQKVLRELEEEFPDILN